MIQIELTNGLFAIIDECDYARVSKHSWHTDISRDGLRIYARTTVYKKGIKKNIRLHRFIMNAKESELVDHIGGNKSTLDCRRQNLRLTNKSQNAANSKINKRNTSGFRGVHFHPQTNKWRSSVTINGKRVSLGLYSDPLIASQVVESKRREQWG